VPLVFPLVAVLEFPVPETLPALLFGLVLLTPEWLLEEASGEGFAPVPDPSGEVPTIPLAGCPVTWISSPTWVRSLSLAPTRL